MDHFFICGVIESKLVERKPALGVTMQGTTNEANFEERASEVDHGKMF